MWGRRVGRVRGHSRPAVIWTSNAFALLGIGALLALVDVLVRRFRYLDKDDRRDPRIRRGQADDVVHIGDVASLAVIVGLLGCGVAASVADRLTPRTPPRRRAGARPAVPSSSRRAGPSPSRHLWLSAERGVGLRAGRGLSQRGLALSAPGS
jgi:hypothetical protein